jgi:hypothetical protein
MDNAKKELLQVIWRKKEKIYCLWKILYCINQIKNILPYCGLNTGSKHRNSRKISSIFLRVISCEFCNSGEVIKNWKFRQKEIKIEDIKSRLS